MEPKSVPFYFGIVILLSSSLGCSDVFSRSAGKGRGATLEAPHPILISVSTCFGLARGMDAPQWYERCVWSDGLVLVRDADDRFLMGKLPESELRTFIAIVQQSGVLSLSSDESLGGSPRGFITDFLVGDGVRYVSGMSRTVDLQDSESQSLGDDVWTRGVRSIWSATSPIRLSGSLHEAKAQDLHLVAQRLHLECPILSILDERYLSR